MTKSDLKNVIIGLCEEDYYGVWELYSSYQNLPATKDLDDELFVATVQELVRETRVVPYIKNKFDDSFDPVDLDLQVLRSELEEVKAGRIAGDFYWFATQSAT